MVLASPGLLLTPPPGSSPPKTPIRSYSAQTPPRNGNPTPPLPGGRCGRRPGRGTGGQNRPQADADALRHPRHCTATTQLRRGCPLTTLQSTKQQPATAGAVERGGFFDRQTHNPFDRQTHNRPLADTRAYSWQTRGRAHGRTEQHLIHMERKQPRDMMPSSTFSGLLPKGVSSTLAIMLLSFCFSKTEPMEKPAMNSSTCTARSS